MSTPVCPSLSSRARLRVQTPLHLDLRALPAGALGLIQDLLCKSIVSGASALRDIVQHEETFFTFHHGRNEALRNEAQNP